MAQKLDSTKMRAHWKRAFIPCIHQWETVVDVWMIYKAISITKPRRKKIAWKEPELLTGVNIKHRPTKHLRFCNIYDSTHSIFLFATQNQISCLEKKIYPDHHFTCIFPNFSIFVSDQTDFTLTERK